MPPPRTIRLNPGSSPIGYSAKHLNIANEPSKESNAKCSFGVCSKYELRRKSFIVRKFTFRKSAAQRDSNFHYKCYFNFPDDFFTQFMSFLDTSELYKLEQVKSKSLMPISLLFEVSESEIAKFADEFIRVFREIIVYENIIIVAPPTRPRQVSPT